MGKCGRKVGEWVGKMGCWEGSFRVASFPLIFSFLWGFSWVDCTVFWLFPTFFFSTWGFFHALWRMGAVVWDGLAAILLDYQGVRRMGNGWVWIVERCWKMCILNGITSWTSFRGGFLSTVSTGYHVNHFFLSSFLKREKAIYFIFALIFSGIVEKGDSFGGGFWGFLIF